MTPIEIMSMVFSIVGAILFIVSLKIEINIIEKLRHTKAYKKWFVILILTIFFLIGYVINIYSLIVGSTEIQLIFEALIFLFGAIFLLIVVYISYSTYKIIFEEAEKAEKE